MSTAPFEPEERLLNPEMPIAVEDPRPVSPVVDVVGSPSKCLMYSAGRYSWTMTEFSGVGAASVAGVEALEVTTWGDREAVRSFSIRERPARIDLVEDWRDIDCEDLEERFRWRAEATRGISGVYKHEC